MKHLLPWLLLFSSFNLPAQVTFKAGSYKQGTIVKSPDGFLWVAERDITNTTTLPKDNDYWAPYVATTVYYQKAGTVNLIQAQINAVPKGGRKEIIIPDGEYHLTQTLTWHDKGIHLIGGANTKIIVPQGVDGIRVTRSGSGAGKSLIKNIYLQTTGEKKGSKSVGFYSNALIKIENCTAKNFGSHGFYFSGHVTADGTDVSGSSVYDCEAIECGGDGFRTQGPDANQIAFYSCSARDNGGIGFNDLSFLGCQWFASMGHANKGGHYHSGDANARAGFFGCYSESDSQGLDLNGMSNVFGGLHEGVPKLSRYSGAQLGAQAYNVDYGWKQVTREGEIIQEFYVRPDGKGSLTHAYLNGPSSEQLFGRGALLEQWDDTKRTTTFAGRAFNHVMIANRFVTFARSVEDLKKWDYYQKFVFIPGDKVYNSDYNGINVQGWTCISKGILGVAKWKAF